MGLAALFAACHDEEESPQIPITVRTVFMYLVADNDISGDIYNNIASVEDGLKRLLLQGPSLFIGMVLEVVNSLFRLYSNMK